jgi:glycosyltransferase involved in cell wall biosynthesis
MPLMPLISVIIASLNDLEHLPRAVKSVAKQNFADWEIVIMDGASQDGTKDYLHALSDPRIVWRSEKDGGLTEAWNKAVALSQGQWLIFLGADDFVWDDGVFSKAAPYLRASDAALAFGEVFIVAEYDDTIVRRMALKKPAFLRNLNAPNDMGIPHQGFFHARRAFMTGPFDTSFRLAADYEFVSRFSKETDFLALPIGPVAAFRMGGLSTDPWNSLETSREMTRIHRMRGRSTILDIWRIAKAQAKIVMRKWLGGSVTISIVNLTRRLRGYPLFVKR